jgi:hypothetical protein
MLKFSARAVVVLCACFMAGILTGCDKPVLTVDPGTIELSDSGKSWASVIVTLNPSDTDAKWNILEHASWIDIKNETGKSGEAFVISVVTVNRPQNTVQGTVVVGGDTVSNTRAVHVEYKPRMDELDEGEYIEPGPVWEGDEPLEGAPAEGAPIEGEVVEGAPVEGDTPVEGEVVEGAPVEGDTPVEGEVVEGAPVEGDTPVEGEVVEGAPVEGDTPLEGEVVEGAPVEGDTPAEGAIVEGAPVEGEVIEGDIIPQG